MSEIDIDCETSGDSECCGATIYNGICSRCKEHAEPAEVEEDIPADSEESADTDIQHALDLITDTIRCDGNQSFDEALLTIRKVFADVLKPSPNRPLICECGDHIVEGMHCHRNGKTYCEICAD